MSYTPSEWKTGDVITAEKLNNMESGIVNVGSSPIFVCHADQDSTIDKTWSEIRQAYQNDKVIILKSADGAGCSYFSACFNTPSFYEVQFFANGYVTKYRATSENGYPVFYEPE